LELITKITISIKKIFTILLGYLLVAMKCLCLLVEYEPAGQTKQYRIAISLIEVGARKKLKVRE